MSSAGGGGRPKEVLHVWHGPSRPNPRVVCKSVGALGEAIPAKDEVRAGSCGHGELGGGSWGVERDAFESSPYPHIRTPADDEALNKTILNRTRIGFLEST